MYILYYSHTQSSYLSIQGKGPINRCSVKIEWYLAVARLGLTEKRYDVVIELFEVCCILRVYIVHMSIFVCIYSMYAHTYDYICLLTYVYLPTLLTNFIHTAVIRGPVPG